jgi:hypothetical protein
LPDIEVPGVFSVEVICAVRAPPKSIGFGSAVSVVVAITIVVATVVIAAAPGGIAVEVIVVVNHRSTVPVTIPGIPPPSATAAASERTESDAGAEADHAGSRHIP